jgi:hypothetical protein
VSRTAGSRKRDPASFRDPSGFVYRIDGVVYRQIDKFFADRWEDFVGSGLLATLQRRGLLIGHEQVPLEFAFDALTAHAVIRPEPVEFISYPFEWSFSQLRDGALLTLDAQEAAAEAGFALRDATAFNVQFHGGRPVLIDSLSFERTEPGRPWVAYRQFCEHFLAPLALMAYRDVRCGLMLREFIDGIPLDLAARLLPVRTRLNLGLGSHVHAHARALRHYADLVGTSDGHASRPARSMSALQQAAFLDSLRRTIERLRWDPAGTEWADYAENTGYSDQAAHLKDTLVLRLISAAGGTVVWDIGANVGRFSRIAASLGRRVIAWDIDPAATELHYQRNRRDGTTSTLPLVMDLGNPSPGLGWANRERRSFLDRADADTILALALFHHLAISRNIPLAQMADLFARLAPALVIEFVPADDDMAMRLIATQRDFVRYTIDGFKAAFSVHFEILDEIPIEGTKRTLFRMGRRTSAA